MNAIQDQFTNLKISRQRKWQWRRRAAGLCDCCGQPVLPGMSKCLKHHTECREYARERKGVKRSSKNTKFTRLAKKLGLPVGVLP